ncbi:MAG: murein biosynthesis integral membrane protein MurJ [Anaerolineae bacterium]|nr:murein biosynthesis integral membrane protein MurJ [Anaerolineae bacterium]
MSRIARAASLVMVLFVISRALGLLREVVVARQFGTSADMDAYVAAFSLPDFLFYVVAGGALGSAFIPVFAGYLTRGDMPGAWRLASAIINWIVLLLSILAGLLSIAAPWLVGWLFGDLSPAQQILTTELMRWMLISTVIFGVSGVVMGILNAQHHFFLPAAAPIIYNLSIIMGAWFLGPIIGVRGLAVGVVVGAAGHLLVQLPGLRWGKERMTYQATFAVRSRSLYEVGRLMAPRVLGLAAVQLNFIVTRVLAAGLAVGSITALYYGWIIMLLPQGIIAQSVATALFPTLAALAAQEDYAEMRHIFATTLKSMLFLTLPAAVGLIVLAQPLIRLLLERGEFNAESTALTAWALSFFALGLIGHAVVEIAVRAFYALKNTKTPVGIGVLAMAINIALSILLMRLFVVWGLPAHSGLALANSIAVTLEMIVLMVLLRTEMGGLSETSLWPSLGKMMFATVGMAVVLLIARPFLPDTPSWLGGVIGVGMGGLVYGGLAYFIGADELKPIQEKAVRIWQKVRRS